jgi:hypothetical protein
MSALGQKQTLDRRPLMSAIPPKADIGTQSRHVRFVPKADILTAGCAGLDSNFAFVAVDRVIRFNPME